MAVDSFFKVHRCFPIDPNWKQRKKMFVDALENFDVPKDTVQNDFSCQWIHNGYKAAELTKFCSSEPWCKYSASKL